MLDTLLKLYILSEGFLQLLEYEYDYPIQEQLNKTNLLETSFPIKKMSNV